MNEVKFAQDFNMATPRQQRAYGIPEGDWNRLKRLIAKITPERQWLSVIASVCFGIAVSSVFSFISSSMISSKPSWIMPSTGAIFASSVVIGIALVVIDSGVKVGKKSDCEEVIQDMSEIEARFH